jgi:uncharacterized membrane protein YqhA
MFFLFLGGRHAWHGYEEVFNHNADSRPGLYFIESLDMFMISLVFMIFSLGIMRLFTHYHEPNEKLPRWLQLNSFGELKELLWETILLTLVIIAVSEVIKNLEHFDWHILMLPGVILVLSISLFFVRMHKGKH